MAAEAYNEYDPPTPPSTRIVSLLDIIAGRDRQPSLIDALPQHFWFRTRRIIGLGSPPDRVHRNVMRLRILPSAMDSVVTGLLRLLPSAVQTCLRRWTPEWFLPAAIVVKTQKPDWEDEFDDELETYRRLRPLQGTVIPHHYGTASVAGMRAHILSDVGGFSLPLRGASGIEDSLFRKMLLRALGSLAIRGFIHDDLKLDNFHLVGDRIVVLDLEQMEFVESDEKRKSFLQASVNDVARMYTRHHKTCLNRWA